MDLAGGITQEDLKLFLQEADEQLEMLDEDIIRLEKEADNPELMQDIFRAAHTLKGSSAMIGHQRMSELAHSMENVLDSVRKDTLAVSPAVVDALLHGLDVMRVLRQELVDSEAEPTDISEATVELAAVMDGDNQPESQKKTPPDAILIDEEAAKKLAEARQSGKKAFLVRVAFDKQSEWISVRCFQIIQELSQIADIVTSRPSQQDIEEGKADSSLHMLITGSVSDIEINQVLGSISDIENTEITEHTGADAVRPASKPSGIETTGAKKDEPKLVQTVRVDIGRLDTLMEQVGELVINRNQINQICRQLGGKYRDDEVVQNLGDCLSQMNKIVGTLQQYVMSIRLLPIEIVFNTLPRMVRDTARKMNKQVDFVIEGQETEVDRSVIEHLRDPLIHLLRNSVDHGIEMPEERRAAGKPETGTIRLAAFHQEDHILIQLTDDGKGIDPESLKKTAVRNNVLSPEDAESLTPEETISLIFSSGFSTAREITEVSGRGVGLDVVKTNIELLGGTVNIESRAGQGTMFTLTLPLTLAIIPALLVATGDTVCAVPLSCIVESNKLEENDIRTVAGREVTMFRGNVLPLLRLGEVFGWESGERKSGDIYVVVVKYAGTQVGITVDALLEEQELVVKSLDSFIGGGNGITGASILGDGTVVLILDVASMVRDSIKELKKGNGKKGTCRPAISPG